MGKKKIILAFSGGLDTSFCALWLKKQGFDVVTMTVDTGGFDKKEIMFIEKQAKLVGAVKHYFLDGKKELYDKFISYIIKGNFLRGGVYPLCAGPERTIIAMKLIGIAQKEKAQAVAHGSTGAGSDQVRLGVALRVLSPEIKEITPIRDLGITRPEELEILKKNNIPVAVVSKKYSVNKSMIGTTASGPETRSSWETLPEDVFEDSAPLAKTPDSSVQFILKFKKGLPVAVNDTLMDGIAIINYLNKLGGKHGVGKGIHLGDVIIGIKGRIGFAAPALTILIRAHKELEKLVLTKWQMFWKNVLSEVYGNFLHEALYFEPLMRDIEAMIDSSQKYVTGKVKVKLFKGNILVEGMESPYSMINPKVALYAEKNTAWDGKEAAGFTKIYGMQSFLAEAAHKKGEKHEKDKD